MPQTNRAFQGPLSSLLLPSDPSPLFQVAILAELLKTRIEVLYCNAYIFYSRSSSTGPDAKLCSFSSCGSGTLGSLWR